MYQYYTVDMVYKCW